MHILFVDESGRLPDKPSKDAKYFSLGGVIIPESKWERLSASLAGHKRAYNVQGEVKWKYFSVGNTDPRNTLVHLNAEKRDALRASLFNVLTGTEGIVLMSATICIEAAYRLPYVNTSEDLYHQTYKALSSRFQYYLQGVSRAAGVVEHGIIIADHRSSRNDQKLRDHHYSLVDEYKTYTSRYDHILEGLFFAPSEKSTGIQYADLVAGAVQYAFERKNPKFLNLILPAFRKNPNTGAPEGYGLVRVPKEGFI